MDEVVGAYRVVREVARGGMGLVLEARAPDGRPVALKLLLSGEGASVEQRLRFAREAEALTRLRHPDLVSFISAGEHRGVPFLAMEWIEGEPLSARLRRDGPLPPREAAALVRRLALAVEYCHRHGLLHRDLKPANVLLRAGSGEPVLADLGLARDGDLSRSALTRTGQALGTPGYWAPEQAGATDRATVRTDVYGLGALLFAALTGVGPTPGDSLQEQLDALARPPLAPSALRAGIPRALDAICLAALARDPARRTASAGAVALSLGEWLARPFAAPDRLPLRVMAVGALLLAAGGTAAATLLLRSTSPPLPAPARPAAPPISTSAATISAVQALADQGDPKGAMALLDRAVADHPEDRLLRRERGSFRAQLGDPAGALLDLERVLSADPRDIEALVCRANVRYRQGDPAGALADLESALVVDPGCQGAIANRGVARMALGDREGARSDFAAALAADPRDLRTLCNRAALHVAESDFPAARTDLDAALALDPRCVRALADRAGVRVRLQDYAGALADAEAALAVDPGSTVAVRSRGSARLGLGDVEGALSDFDRVLARVPPDPYTLSARGAAYGRLGRLEESLRDFDAALALDPDYIDALSDRGMTRAGLGDARALEDFDRALAHAPGRPDLLYSRALGRMELGDLTGAEADLAAILSRSPDEPSALYTRGVARLRRQDLAAGLADWERFLALAPTHPEAATVRAELPRLRAAVAAAPR